MLALGIGATTGIFSLYNEVLLRPLPVPAPARLVNLKAPGPKPGSHSCTGAGSCEYVFSYPMFRDLEARQSVFTGIAGHVDFSASLAYGRETLSASGVLVSGDYFAVLNIKPALGRLIGSCSSPVRAGKAPFPNTPHSRSLCCSASRRSCWSSSASTRRACCSRAARRGAGW